MQPLTAERRYPMQVGPMQAMLQTGPQGGRGPARRDPAPTRAAYRMQRLWLTPAFRILLRFGLPVALVLLLVGGWQGSETRRAALIAWAGGIRDTFVNRPEFRVSVLQVTGASPALDAAIRGRLAIRLPISSFDLDIPAAREQVQMLDAVASAEVTVAAGGVLSVAIRERQPAMIWRRGAELDLLDPTGRRVAKVLARSDRPDLPVIAGEGADLAATEALAIVAAAKPVLSRIRGLVRVGERRWDLVLDRDQRVLLPAREPVRALERLLALDKAEDLLNRNILTVDLRNQLRPTLRLAPNALREMRRARGLATVESAP